MHLNSITEQIIGGAIEVHRMLGPGLLESAYEECLCREMTIRSTPFERQKPLPVEYKGIVLDCRKYEPRRHGGHRDDERKSKHRDTEGIEQEN